MHPSDMILEQSNDDEESYLDCRPNRRILQLGDKENVSLIEDDYIIVDAVKDQSKGAQAVQRNKRSFFEDSLIVNE